MENKGFKFFKKGSAFLIAPALFSNFLPGVNTSAAGETVFSEAARESSLPKPNSGALSFFKNNWGWFLVGGAFVACLLAYLFWPSKDDESPNLGEQINQDNNNNNENNINNNINNNYDLSYNNTNVVDQGLKKLYRQELDKYKNTLTVNIAKRQINSSSGTFFRYNWVSVKGRYLVKLDKFTKSRDSIGQPIYIFPTADGQVFGFYDASNKKDLSLMRWPCDLINFVALNSFFTKAFDGSLFLPESVKKCSEKEFLFEQYDFKYNRCLEGPGEDFLALFELIKERDPNFWNMKNDPNEIRKDIWLQQQKKMMAMNNNGMLLNMGNNMQPMMPNMNMLNNNMLPNNNMGNNGMMMGNNNNQSFGNQNQQGMNNGFQGNNNNNGGFPQQMWMNNPQFSQGQGQNNFFNNDGNINFPQK